MGLFSWITADTNESIPVNGSNRECFPVTVLCPDGTKLTEQNYEGYGIFSGKDIYQLVAQWNRPEECNGDVDHDRGIGIDIACYDSDNEKLKYPIKIVRDSKLKYDDIGCSNSCPDQGFFY